MKSGFVRITTFYRQDRGRTKCERGRTEGKGGRT